MIRPGQTEIVTYDRSGNTPRQLSQLGFMKGLRYSFTNPGGPDQLSFNFQRESKLRTDALYPGRRISAIRGASVVWQGTLDEPDFTANASSGGGAQVTAHGAGTFGADVLAVYPGAWSTNPDSSLNAAITRGLPWINPGVNGTSGLYLGQATDSGAQTITDLMNLVCSRGGLTWYVSTRPRGNVLSVYPLPTTPTHVLIATQPVSRTLFGFANTIYARYQNSALLGKPPGFTTTSVQNASSVAAHGPIESFIDLSSSGFQPSVTPVTNALSGVLAKYVRTMFSGPFQVQFGQLLTMGGTAVDLGMQETANMVCRLMLADYAQGGELSASPISFLVGAYEYDDDSMTASITPFQSTRTDLGSALARIKLKGYPGPKLITERIQL